MPSRCACRVTLLLEAMEQYGALAAWIVDDAGIAKVDHHPRRGDAGGTGFGCRDPRSIPAGHPAGNRAKGLKCSHDRLGYCTLGSCVAAIAPIVPAIIQMGAVANANHPCETVEMVPARVQPRASPACDR